MEKKKWRPKRDDKLLGIMRDWFKKNPIIVCHPQLKWHIATSPKEFIDGLFNEFGDYFRDKGYTKENVIFGIRKVFDDTEIYPYKQLEKRFSNELQKWLNECSRIMEHESEAVSIEDTNLAENIEIEREYKGERIGRYKRTIQTPSEIENTIIDKIEPDIEKMKKEGLSTREIAERLKGKKGTSKSSIHRKTKPKK